MLLNIHKIVEKNKTEEDQVYLTTILNIDPNNWSKTMEGGEEYILQFFGVNGAPLIYTYSKTLKPIAVDDFPDTNYL